MKGKRMFIAKSEDRSISLSLRDKIDVILS